MRWRALRALLPLTRVAQATTGMRKGRKRPAPGFSSAHALGSLAAATLLALLAWANAAPAADFEKGTTRLSFSAGFGSAAGERYYLLGAGVGYYLINGLGTGLAAEIRRGLEPDLTKITPWLEYSFGAGRGLRPFVGAFYRHISVSGQDDYESWGYRGGVYLRAGGNVWAYAGLVQEELIDCNGRPATVSCSTTYSEAGFVFSF